MNFWNNPEYAPFKIAVIVILLFAAGHFILNYMNKGNVNAGRVINDQSLLKLIK